jgi:hypothetical protein
LLYDPLAEIQAIHSQKRSLLGFEKCQELENLVAKVQYLYQTPTALLALILQAQLAQEEVIYYWSKPEYRYYLLGAPFNPNPREQEWIERIDFICSYQL